LPRSGDFSGATISPPQYMQQRAKNRSTKTPQWLMSGKFLVCATSRRQLGIGIKKGDYPRSDSFSSASSLLQPLVLPYLECCCRRTPSDGCVPCFLCFYQNQSACSSANTTTYLPPTPSHSSTRCCNYVRSVNELIDDSSGGIANYLIDIIQPPTERTTN